MAAALAPLNDANLRRYAARVPGARPAYRALRRTRRAFSTAWQRLLCHLWLSHNVSATPGMPQARPVFVLFTPRSGSQFLAELMNSVPSVEMRGELLHRHALRRGRWSRIADWAPQMTVSFWRRGAYQSYLTGGLAAPGARVTGCTLSQFQLAGTGLGLDDLVEWFDDARFIILYRRSLAEQCLSWHLSLLTRQWRWTEDSRSNSPFEGRVRLERRAVLNRFELVRQFYSELLEHPEQQPFRRPGPPRAAGCSESIRARTPVLLRAARASGAGAPRAAAQLRGAEGRPAACLRRSVVSVARPAPHHRAKRAAAKAGHAPDEGRHRELRRARGRPHGPDRGAALLASAAS